MTRSSRMAAGVLGWTALLTAAFPAEEPAKKIGENKPPWQRYLSGADAAKAVQLEKQLNEGMEAGQLPEAIKKAEALLELRQKVQGADHFQAIDARWLVSTLRRFAQQGEETRKEYQGVFALIRQADALEDQGRSREAQSLEQKILGIRRKVLGEEHPDTAASYNSLARTLVDQAKYTEALEINHKALAISRKVLNDEHPLVARIYNDLGGNFYHLGKFVQAEESFRKALAIQFQVVGKEHSSTALSYNNLGVNLQAQGKFVEAEESFRKALALQRKLLGEEHYQTASTYMNLALDLQEQGKYAQAEEGSRKALTLFRKVLGEEHPRTAMCYNNVAGSLEVQGKYAEAEEGFRKALAIQLRVLGEEHPDTALSYNNLAAVLNDQRKYVQAEEVCTRALAIRRRVLGEEHPLTAQSYNNLAANRNDQGKYAQAEEGLRKALAIYRTMLGDANPITARGYSNVAHNQNAQGKYAEAETFYRKAAEIFAKGRLSLARSGLERASQTSERSTLPAFAALLARNGKSEEAWQRFEESLARGTWDDLTARRRPAAVRKKQAQIIAHIDRLSSLIEQTASAKQATSEQHEHRAALLTQLRQAQDELADFTQQLEKTYGPVAGQVYPREKIQAALPPHAALVGWLDIPGQVSAKDSNGEHWAVLLRSSGDPLWVKLPGTGDKSTWTKEDNRLPSELRTALQSAGDQWQPLADRLRQQRLQPLAQHLKGVRRLIVLPSIALAGLPVETIAEGYTVSYAHSGTLHAYLRQQPAAANQGLFALADPVFDPPARQEKVRPLPPGGVLLTMVLPGSNAAHAELKPNDVLLRYGERKLNGPEDLKRATEAVGTEKPVPVLVWREGEQLARPLFVRPGKLGVVVASEPALQAVAEQRRLDRRLASRSGDEGKWARLPGTRAEVAALQRLFDGSSLRVLLDSESSEQRLSEVAKAGELGKYRYLHLATHGEVDNTFPLRSALILSRDRLPDDKERAELLLSGKPITDGRLTAEEVLGSWELHCDLVTFSACQTALGKYERGEGFLGFSQALVLCGTRSVCLSLWKVDDTATALLMERFYQNLLGKREGLKAPLAKAEALSEAKAWLRDLRHEEAAKHAAALTKGVPRSERPALPPVGAATAAATDRPFAHPYYWASFVLIGHAN